MPFFGGSASCPWAAATSARFSIEFWCLGKLINYSRAFLDYSTFTDSQAARSALVQQRHLGTTNRSAFVWESLWINKNVRDGSESHELSQPRIVSIGRSPVQAVIATFKRHCIESPQELMMQLNTGHILPDAFDGLHDAPPHARLDSDRASSSRTCRHCSEEHVGTTGALYQSLGRRNLLINIHLMKPRMRHPSDR